MAKLERLKEVINFGDIELIVTEQPHKKTKQFLKLLSRALADGSTIEFAAEGFSKILENILLEKPFEALQIFIPDLTEEIFEEASNRELIYAFKTVAKLNGVDLEKITKNLQPLMSLTK